MAFYVISDDVIANNDVSQRHLKTKKSMPKHQEMWHTPASATEMGRSV